MKNTHDPINDLIIRIKNAYLARRGEVKITHSNFKESIIRKLQELGLVGKVEVSGEKKKIIIVQLRYEGDKPAFTEVRIFSKPGRRWYVKKDEIGIVLGGLGYSLISTPKGLLTGKEAKKMKVGGELLFSIW